MLLYRFAPTAAYPLVPASLPTRPATCLPACLPASPLLLQPTSGFDYSAEAYVAALQQFVAAAGIRQPFALVVQGYVLGQYGLLYALENDGEPRCRCRRSCMACMACPAPSVPACAACSRGRPAAIQRAT